MMKVKTDELPGSAKHLYIKFYCERKGGINEINLKNAAQSWLSLNISKKQYFIDTIATKYAVDKAQKIIKTEPYLKEKNPIRDGDNSKVCNNIATGHVASVQDEEMEGKPSGLKHVKSVHDDDLPSTEDDGIEADNSDNPHPEENVEQIQQDDMTTQEDGAVCGLQQTQASDKELNTQNSIKNVVDKDTDSSIEHLEKEETVPLPEPVLPPIKTGKDLFELIKAKNGESHRSYEMLTKREKLFYGHAVIAIKRDYVKKYREYLDSLSKRQLFDYYMKVLG